MCHVSSAGGSAFNCSPSQLTEKEPVTANRHNGPMRRRHGSRDRGPPMGAELRAQVTRLKEPLRAGGCWPDCGLRTNCLATELLGSPSSLPSPLGQDRLGTRLQPRAASNRHFYSPSGSAALPWTPALVRFKSLQHIKSS